MDSLKVLNKVGSRIRALRMQKNISQIRLAFLCNFEKASMSRLETGKTNMSLLTLYKISKALDVPMSEFFREDQDETAKARSFRDLNLLQTS